MSVESWRATLSDATVAELFDELKSTGVPKFGIDIMNPKAMQRKFADPLVEAEKKAGVDENPDAPAPSWTVPTQEWALLVRHVSPFPATPRNSWPNPMPDWVAAGGDGNKVMYCRICYPSESVAGSAAFAGNELCCPYDVHTHEKCGMHTARLRPSPQPANNAPAPVAPESAVMDRLALLERELVTTKAELAALQREVAKTPEEFKRLETCIAGLAKDVLPNFHVAVKTAIITAMASQDSAGRKRGSDDASGAAAQHRRPSDGP
jgi:hypothetical protein